MSKVDVHTQCPNHEHAASLAPVSDAIPFCLSTDLPAESAGSDCGPTVDMNAYVAKVACLSTKSDP